MCTFKGGSSMISFKLRLKNKLCAPPKSCRICEVPLCFHRTLRFRSLGSKDGGGVPLCGAPPVLSLDCDATGGWCRIQEFFQQCGSVPKFGVLKIHALLLVMPTCFGRCAFCVWEPRCPNVERASKYVGRLNRSCQNGGKL